VKRLVSMAAIGLTAGSLVITSVSSAAASTISPTPKDIHLVTPGSLTPTHRSTGLPTNSAQAPKQTSVSQLIVKTTNGKLPTSAILQGATAYSGGVQATTVRRLAAGMTVIRFAKPISAAVASRVTAKLTARADVSWAHPNHHFVSLGASPVPDHDAYFADQWDLWDSTYKSPNGGYSVKAPLAWQHERGNSNVVVAILDTGITPHSELTSAVFPTSDTDRGYAVPYGYDFISDPFTANDNDPQYTVPAQPTTGMPSSRDTNPLDNGDWVTAADVANYGSSTKYGCGRVDTSSWHGTHLAGTIAAAQDTQGISGIAPGVKIVPVRVLGKCGGDEADVIDAIEWASGHPILGVPVNAHPASVINMSLGRPGICSDGLQTAINDARAAGTTVVVAAGNDGTDITAVDDYTGSSPGDCAGVIAVSATGRAGELAAYSNYGTVPGAITIAAPGGDDFSASGANNILSTWWNSQTSLVAGSSDYALMAGTSMATPHVAAVVALMQSHVTTPLTPDQVALRLRETASPFPAFSGCSTTLCGSGILNAGAAIPTPPGASDYVNATPLANDAMRLAWSRQAWGGSPILSYVVEMSDNAGQTWTAATASAPSAQGQDLVSTITGLTHGATYRFRIAAVNQLNQGSPAAYAWASTTTGVTTATSPSIPNQVLQPSGKGGVEKISLSWLAPTTGVPATGYRVYLRKRGSTAGWTTIASTLPATARSFTYSPWPSAALAAGIYDIRVGALSGSNPGPTSLSRAVAVTALAQTSTVSSTMLYPARDGFHDSVALRATSNAPRPGSFRIRNSAGAVIKTWTVPATSSSTFVWTGLNAKGTRVPFGTYSVELWRPVRATTAQLVSRTSISVRSSQAAIPSINLVNDTVYPHKDGYLDTIAIRASAVVPSTYVLDIVDKGRVIYHRSYLRRASLSVAWNAMNDNGKVVPAGAYTLRISARGAEGSSTTKLRKIQVSSLRAIPKTFSLSFDAQSAMQFYSSGVNVLGSGSSVQIDGGDDPKTAADMEVNLATFGKTLPASIMTPRSVTVYACTTHSNNTAHNNAFLGYFSGTPDNPYISGAWAYQVGDAPRCYETKAAAPAFSIVNGSVQFWVGNGSLPGNPWTIDSFKVTGVSYVLRS